MSPLVKQTWTVMGVLFNMLGMGMLISFTSILLPVVMAPDSDIQIDLYSASWIASVIGPAGIPGYILSSILMNLYGRKFTHAVLLLPGIFGWLCIYLAKSTHLLLIGRALGGFSIASIPVGAIVIGEYTSPKNRGMFLNLKTAAVCFGIMIVHVLGQFCDWRTVALVALVPSISALLINFTWQESPAWLASKKQFKKSQKSFTWLRGSSPESAKEIEELLSVQKSGDMVEFTSNSLRIIVRQFLNKIKRTDFLKPVMIVIVYGILLETSGQHIFPAFALQIIEDVTGNKAQTLYYSFGIDIIITTSVVFSSALTKFVKRRTLLFGSGFMSLLVLYSICIYLFLTSRNIISTERTFIPLSLFGVYFIITNLGCGTLARSILGEIFPLAHSEAGICVSSIILSLNLMFVMHISPYLLSNVKVHGTFAVFGSVMGLLLIVLWFILPETKDKTLQEIENYIKYGNYYNVIDKDEGKQIMIRENELNILVPQR